MCVCVCVCVCVCLCWEITEHRARVKENSISRPFVSAAWWARRWRSGSDRTLLISAPRMWLIKPVSDKPFILMKCAGTYWLTHTFTSIYCLCIAVAEKNLLEGETGLKIIQTGVGEVCLYPIFMSSNRKPWNPHVLCDQQVYRLAILGAGWYNEPLSLVSQRQNWPHRALFST